MLRSQIHAYSLDEISLHLATCPIVPLCGARRSVPGKVSDIVNVDLLCEKVRHDHDPE